METQQLGGITALLLNAPLGACSRIPLAPSAGHRDLAQSLDRYSLAHGHSFSGSGSIVIAALAEVRIILRAGDRETRWAAPVEPLLPISSRV